MKTVAPAPAAVSAVSLPNVLTYLRILAVPAVVLCLFLVPGSAGRWWALAVYIGACITDWLDGYLARKHGSTSAFGRNFDPLVDKVLICGAFIFLLPVPEAHLAPWMVTIPPRDTSNETPRIAAIGP